MKWLIATALLFTVPAFAAERQYFYKGHSSYEAPIECRHHVPGKVCKVPISVWNALDNQEKAWAHAFANENGIPYKFVHTRPTGRR